MLRIGQVEATATQDGKYTDGSVAGGIAATRLRAAAFNAMQEELAHIVESAGLALDINDMTQVLKAIQKLTLSRANPFADIKSDGAAAISTALTNLGLGEIATVADIQAGKASKLVGAEGLKKYLPTKVMQVSGFIRIPDVPGGTIIQWGQVTGTINEGTKNVVLPTPFPNSGRFAIAIPLNLAGDTSCDIFAQLQSASLTGINFFFSWVSSSTPANGFQWFAIGY
ncbi:gp53-like domain-containing protein [Escherichia sp. MAL-1]